jgi:hypothetical protein
MSTIQGAGNPSDRRDNQRFEVEVIVQIHLPGGVVDWPSEDISAGGMRLRVAGDPPKIGSRLKVSFRLPLLAAPIEAEGEVRWVDRGTPTVCGIQFSTG